MAEEILVEARSLMERALELLDRAGSAHDIGAHLDLALVKLSDMLTEREQASENDNFMIGALDQPAAEPFNSLK